MVSLWARFEFGKVRFMKVLAALLITPVPYDGDRIRLVLMSYIYG